MAEIAMKQTYTFRDAKGNLARLSLYVADDNTGVAFPNAAQGDAHQILNDVVAISNAALQRAHGPYTTEDGITLYGLQAVYEDCCDKAYFFFADAFGGKHTYAVPAPKAAIFAADGETIVNTNALVKQLVADMLNAAYRGTAPTGGMTNGARTAANLALVQFLGGYRARRKMPRRTTIQLLTPDLSGPEE